MKRIFIIIALLMLSACSWRGWDPPNHSQALCGPACEAGEPRVQITQAGGNG